MLLIEWNLLDTIKVIHYGHPKLVVFNLNLNKVAILLKIRKEAAVQTLIKLLYMFNHLKTYNIYISFLVTVFTLYR